MSSTLYTSPVSYTSSWTTTVMQWRNFQGEEKNWIGFVNGGRREQRNPELIKVLITEIACSILLAAAVCETAFYTAQWLSLTAAEIVVRLALTLSNFAQRRFSLAPLPAQSELVQRKENIYKLLNSSAFTVFWNATNLTYLNIKTGNAPTLEYFARSSVTRLLKPFLSTALLVICAGTLLIIVHNASHRDSIIANPFAADPTSYRTLERVAIALSSWEREEDRAQIARYILSHQLRIPAVTIIFSQESQTSAIWQGVTFLNDYFTQKKVFSPEDQQDVEECCPDAIQYIATRAVYLYAFGEKKADPIPKFFQEKTIIAISKLREKANLLDTEKKRAFLEFIWSNFSNSKKELKELYQSYLSSSAPATTDPSIIAAAPLAPAEPIDPQVLAIVSEIKEAGSRDLQGKNILLKNSLKEWLEQ